MLRLSLHGHGLTFTTVGFLALLVEYTPASVLAIIIVLIRLTEIDPKQLETVEPPASELCDHSSKRCNGCWKGYPQSLFQNWTQGQVKKAKIYNLIHNYSKIKPCVYYRADVNDRGLIFHTREITTVYGDEDIIWDNLVHEHVSCSSHIICRALPENFFF